MKYFGLLALLPILCVSVQTVDAASLNDQPAHFYQDAVGDWYGQTVSGVRFSQKNVTNDADIRLQRFVMDDISYYISDRGMIWADSSLQAVSIYFGRQA